MNRLFRLTLPLALIVAVTGCSSVSTKQSSDLREIVDAPLELSSTHNTEFCLKPEPVEPTPIVMAPAPFAAKLYFLLDKTEFTAESALESKEIYQEILDRNPSEVIISGHTDTSASNQYNEKLSQRRALRVKQDLVDLGFPAYKITTDYEGEYRLLVATPDETVEVRNRRVEINLR